MSHSLLTNVRKLSSIAFGLASRRHRVGSASRLLAYSLNSMPLSCMMQYLKYAPRLPDAALIDAKILADRLALLKLLPQGGIVAEIGVFRGEFSNVIAQACQPDEFHLIDIDLSPLSNIPPAAETHEGDSSTILSQFPVDYFDWLYIDGDHSYDGVKRDLQAAHLALKSGGHLMCNDYANWCSAAAQPYGIARAVNELILEEKYQVIGLGLHPAGLHDILLRKP